MSRLRACLKKIAVALCSGAFLAAFSTVAATDLAEAPKRIPFTDSRLVGSPDPPLPYRAKRAFPKLDFKHPLYVTHLPASDHVLVVEQSERILAFTNDADAAVTAEFCFIKDHEIYSVIFHPGFLTNRLAFVFANGPQSASSKTNKIYRYEVDRQNVRCLSASRTLIIEWESNGHNGGDLAFGPDGMLYLSSGDGTSDSDRNHTGQDITDLTSGILRIDVEHVGDPEPETASAGPGRTYRIPADNPFLSVPGARGELWAYGFRNPWRIHFDAAGNLWVGDIGQDLWELIIIVQRGANYGWSITEGGHPFQLQRRPGPTPISPPTIEHSHAEARSITGGLTYRGRKFPKLRGAYIYGDYGTGRIWSARYENGRITWNEVIADTPSQILGFGEDPAHEILFADYLGQLYEFEATPVTSPTNAFPRRLSETGLFVSVQQHRLHPGVIPYSVNAGYWSDGAHMERFIALPGDARIEFQERDGWKFPEGTVLGQSLALEMESGNPQSRRWIETRLLLLQQNEWAGYSYRWNEKETDAELLGDGGDDADFRIKDAAAPNRTREQTWHFPSRSECLTCHSRAAGFVLGLKTAQLNRERDGDGAMRNQLSWLAQHGVFAQGNRSEDATLPRTPEKLPRLVNPYDAAADLTARARSYLHVNCSHCHQEAGGGNSAMDLRLNTKLERMRVIDEKPLHDTFELPEARLIAPGHPERSVLLRRLSQRGFGQMPPLAIQRVDERAVELLQAWIRSLEAEGNAP